jgi:hypothetical protein
MRKKMPNPYKNTVRPKIGRSVFDLSYTHKLTMNMGDLVPVMTKAMVPNDLFSIAHNLVIRFQPLNAPPLHEVNAFIETFFVPYRLLWDDWESFITGGEDGTEAPTMTTWQTSTNTAGTLWDYLGFPLGINPGVSGRPIFAPAYAYNMIYNEYYRDQTQQTEIALTNTTLKTRNWEKDYFTSALPWEQRGTAPALPVTLSGTVDVDGNSVIPHMKLSPSGTEGDIYMSSGALTIEGRSADTGDAIWGSNTGLEVDFSAGTATTFDVNDLRLAFQTQKLLERMATGGSRYEEFLQSMYASSPGDARIQRPEWIGGMKVPVIFSEVLQTSEDGTTPQGTMAGHGITVGQKRIGTYRAKEFGVIMSILSVMPKAAYSQGVHRDWLKSTRYDFFNPLFSNLGEQAITHAEIYASATQSENETVFGYQGRYNEMRNSMDMVSGEFGYNETYEYWHFGRQFASKPSLNSAFLTYDGRTDAFAASSEPQLLVNCGNIIKAVRPIPIMPNPGYIDH